VVARATETRNSFSLSRSCPYMPQQSQLYMQYSETQTAHSSTSLKSYLRCNSINAICDLHDRYDTTKIWDTFTTSDPVYHRDYYACLKFFYFSTIGVPWILPTDKLLPGLWIYTELRLTKYASILGAGDEPADGLAYYTAIQRQQNHQPPSTTNHSPPYRHHCPGCVAQRSLDCGLCV